MPSQQDFGRTATGRGSIGLRPGRARPRLPDPARRGRAGGAGAGRSLPRVTRPHLALRSRRDLSRVLRTRRPHPPPRPGGHLPQPPPSGPSRAGPGLLEAAHPGRGDGLLLERLGPRGHGQRSQGRLLPYSGPMALPVRSLSGRAVAGLGLDAVDDGPVIASLGPSGRGLGRPVPGQLERRPAPGVRALRDRCRGGPSARRRRSPGRPGAGGRYRAGLRPLRVPTASLQERRGGHRGLRAPPRTASGGGGERAPGRPDHRVARRPT